MKTFYESTHCTSQKHCKVCRATSEDGKTLRTEFLKRYPELKVVDFECPQQRRWGWQLGDMVAQVATPIARALGLDCIDKQTLQLKAESPCAKRKRLLNQL